MKSLCTFALLSLFSFSAFASTCYVMGKETPEAEEFNVVIATINNAFENPAKSHLLAITKDGTVIEDLTAVLESISTEEEFNQLVKKIDGAKALSFSQDEEGMTTLFSGMIDASKGESEAGMFVARTVARGSSFPNLLLVDYGSDLAMMCQ